MNPRNIVRMAALAALGGAIWAVAQVSGGTVQLGAPLSVSTSEGSGALYDAMETVGTTVTTAKTEGVDKTLEILQAGYQKASEGNRHAAKQMSGMTKGADARTWQANQAGKAGFIRKIRLVGDLIEIVDSFSGAAGYLAEGDTTGAAAVFINGLGKKGASALGAAAGSVGGPVGAVVGAEGGDRIYKGYVEGKVNKLADDKRDQDARDRLLGLPMAGRYSGNVIWIHKLAYDASTGAPPVTFRFQGPMTADVDRDGNLKMHFDLKGTMEGLGLAGQTAGISMGLQMGTRGDLTGTAKDGQFTARGTATSDSTFNVDFGGRPGAPQNQSQRSQGGGALEAQGTFTRETLQGSITSSGAQAQPITFVLTKGR